MIPEPTLAHIISELEFAPYGGKTDVVDRWSKVLGVSCKTIYRNIKSIMGITKKKRIDAGKRMNKNMEEWTRIVWMIKLRPPKENGVIPTDIAIKIAVREGLIPKEAGEICISSYNRVARDLEFNHTAGRFARFQAKYPNLTHQFDASTSNSLHIARKLPDGEIILKLHRKAANYKNKPVPIRLRPVIYGIVDDHSGLHYARYTASEGENAADGLEFLMQSWAEKKHKKITFRGLPRLLYMDNGPVSKAAPVTEFLKRLDVTKINSTPYAARGKGKIERPWRTMWNRFELSLFVVDDWKNFEITLTELNRQFDNYIIEYSNGKHRYNREITRQQSWDTIALRGGVVDISQHALSSVFKRAKRKVTGGYFSYQNEEYEVIGLDNASVWVHEGIFNDKLIVQDMRTHSKYEVITFKPLPFGKRLEIVKTKAEEIAIASHEEISIKSTFYSESESATSNLVKIPVKGTKKEIENPLDIPEIKDDSPRIFATERDRYEYLLETNEPLTSNDKMFMTAFEKTDLYQQLKGTYAKWNAHNKKTAVAGGR